MRLEQRGTGAADPAESIDPLMQHQWLGYRVSLLSSAAQHGSTHQAAMIFQVVAPRQLRDLRLDANRFQFNYQEAETFAACNDASFVEAIETPAGSAVVVGVELPLLDCVRHVHRAGGLGSVRTSRRILAHTLIRVVWRARQSTMKAPRCAARGTSSNRRRSQAEDISMNALGRCEAFILRCAPRRDTA